MNCEIFQSKDEDEQVQYLIISNKTREKTPWQKANEAEEMLKAEQSLAEKRKKAGIKIDLVAKSPQGSGKGRARDIVAKELRMRSGREVDRAAASVRKAKALKADGKIADAELIVNTYNKTSPSSAAELSAHIDRISEEDKQAIRNGQARVNSAIYRYHKGLTNDPYIPAMILTNVTEEDCALLFAMQDDNTTLVTPRHKLETRIVGKDELIIDFLERLNNNGMPVYDAEKNSVISDFTAIKTYQDIYKKFSKNNNLATFDRICRTISKAFVVLDGRNKRSFKKHSLCAPIIRMMSEFYSRYASEINDDVFVKNLLRFEPDGIVLKIERNVPSGKEPNSDKGFRYVLTALEIYNDKFANKKRGDRLTYKI